ncbi:MAG TPA: DoxX family protein [Candidatus Saccharimonadales bacterium]|nr:DoxX family protein [Candidatus Saccharimonadales bacterium]
MNKSMNILLWILQVLLAVYYLAGGVYMMGHYQLLATAQAYRALPQFAWITLGILEVLFALGLIFPGVFKKSHKLTFISAIGLIVISLLGVVLYVTYKGSGILWAIVPAIFLAFIAYERRK